jgi:CTP-dependent riboflavin kinase
MLECKFLSHFGNNKWDKLVKEIHFGPYLTKLLHTRQEVALISNDAELLDLVGTWVDGLGHGKIFLSGRLAISIPSRN